MNTDNMVKLLIYIFLVMKSHALSDYQECDDYLISGPRGIPDGHLSASSSYSSKTNVYDPKFARLYLYMFNPETGRHAAGWSAEHRNNAQYIQATFLSTKIIKAIMTQGRFDEDQWVASYYVTYSTDGITWSTVRNPDKTKVIFRANTDRTTVVNNTLSERVEAKYIRIHPMTWYGHVSLRFDVIGCTALTTKTLRNQMIWKRHPVDLSLDGSVRKIIHWLSPDMQSCAKQCQKNEQCVMFSFNEVVSVCTGFPTQGYQGKKSSLSNLRNDQYFISLSYLNAYEYEIVESKMFAYKIFTWSTTAASALNECHKEGTRLLTVHNIDQIEYVQNKTKNNLILSQQPQFFVDGSFKDGKWTYSTGIDVPPGLWTLPPPQKTNNSCVTLTLSGLQPHDCNDSLYFVCGV